MAGVDEPVEEAEVYGQLVHETHDLGGMIGNGGPAAGQGSVAAARMQKLDADGLGDAKQVGRFERTNAGIDERLCNAVEHGTRERLYFQRVVVPGMSNYNGALVRVMRPKYLPITSPVQTDLLAIVRSGLRPAPIQPKPPEGAVKNRIDFEAAINHRPGQDNGIGL